MFKIMATEIKKIVSKPGIYILSVLLAIILVLGAFIYNPKVYVSSQFELEGNTFIDKYDNFYPSQLAGKKAESLASLESSLELIDDYYIDYNSSTYTQKELIELKLTQLNESLDRYRDCANDGSIESVINTARLSLISKLQDFNTTVENAFINSQKGSFSILTSKENYKLYKSAYDEIFKWSKSTISQEKLDEHFIEFDNKLSNNFYSSIRNFKYPTLSSGFVSNYTTLVKDSKYSILNARLNKIEEDIETQHNKALTDSEFNTKQYAKMDKLANDYVNTISTYTLLIKYELITNAFSILSTSEHLNTLYLSEYSNFDAKSLLARYTYLFDNNKSENDFARPLTIGVSSNDNINAYDYAYFVLKIFSFVIIIYSVTASCHSIAGEIKEGSMRYLAIRPVSRKSMFFGKWFAILFMSMILILFSGLISLMVGSAVYGMSSNTILAIFDGSMPLTLHPLAMIGIYLLSMFLELVVYSIIAMMFSVLFKSDLMSVTILLVIYLLNNLIPVFVQSANSWLAFYPFSHISLYSLFGSSVYSVQHNFFNLVFGAKTYANTQLTLTLSIIALITIVIAFIAVKVFKKKEL